MIYYFLFRLGLDLLFLNLSCVQLNYQSNQVQPTRSNYYTLKMIGVLLLLFFSFLVLFRNLVARLDGYEVNLKALGLWKAASYS